MAVRRGRNRRMSFQSPIHATSSIRSCTVACSTGRQGRGPICRQCRAWTSRTARHPVWVQPTRSSMPGPMGRSASSCRRRWSAIRPTRERRGANRRSPRRQGIARSTQRQRSRLMEPPRISCTWRSRLPSKRRPARRDGCRVFCSRPRSESMERPVRGRRSTQGRREMLEALPRAASSTTSS
jgi:hypothetical protein